MATVQFDVALEMEMLTCWECGIQYAVPSKWFETKMERDEDDVCCPNGHENSYQRRSTPAGDLGAENDKLRREIIRVTHEADQAMARAMEGRPQREPTLEPDEPIVAETSNLVADGQPITSIRVDERNRLYCPRCDRRYRFQSGIAKHLREAHGEKNADGLVMQILLRLSAERASEQRK